MHTMIIFLLHVLNLLKDQLLNLAITLIVVDRFLAWRERRRWKRIRHLIELQFEAGLGDFLRSWARWLAQLRSQGKSLKLSDTALAILTERKLPTKATLPAEDFEDFLALCAGQPIPTPGERSFVDAVQPRNFHTELFGHLVNTSLDGDDMAWRTLVSELQALVPKFASLVERIPEKAASSDTLQYRQFIEGLYLLVRKVDPALHDPLIWNEEQSLLDRAESIAFNIVAAVMLMKVFRTSFRAEQ